MLNTMYKSIHEDEFRETSKFLTIGEKIIAKISPELEITINHYVKSLQT